MSPAAANDSTILQFLKTQPMAVVATIAADSWQPESALIAFTQTSNLEIIFETFVDSRKYQNLQQNPRTALVIGWDMARYITVQYEGIAAPVDSREYEMCVQAFRAKDTPCTEQFLRDSRVRFFKVKPTWIRYSDYTLDPPHIVERTYEA